MPMDFQTTNLLCTRLQLLAYAQLWLQLRAANATNLCNRKGVAGTSWLECSCHMELRLQLMSS